MSISFFESDACKCEVHCEVCRNRELGVKFRTHHPYTLPEGGADFDCPSQRGAKPWGYVAPPRPPIEIRIPLHLAREAAAPRELKPPDPLPENEWPLLVRGLIPFRVPEDTGAGDTLERLLRKVGGAGFKAALKAAGIPCGCDDRQRWMNARFPYGIS